MSSEMGILHKIEILRWGEASDNPIYQVSFIFFIQMYFYPLTSMYMYMYYKKYYTPEKPGIFMLWLFICFRSA